MACDEINAELVGRLKAIFMTVYVVNGNRMNRSRVLNTNNVRTSYFPLYRQKKKNRATIKPNTVFSLKKKNVSFFRPRGQRRKRKKVNLGAGVCVTV